jgi:predicted nucleic acid-binding protein
MLGDIHAPSLIDVEVTQTLRGLVRGSKLELAAAERARDELAQLAVRRHPDRTLLRRAWELRDVCTTYDALYVALAEALDAMLLTRDGPLATGIKDLVDVVVSG